MTLNDRLMSLIQQEIGDDPTAMMMLTMFQGNLQAIPENELRLHLEKYLRVLTNVLNN